MVEVSTEPYFADVSPQIPLEPDDTAPSAVEIIEIAQNLERGIRDDPERFQTVLANLGDVATSGSQKAVEKLGITVDDRPTVNLILRFFSTHADRVIRFDEATETALDADTAFNDALAVHKSSKRKRYQKSAMSSFERADENAEPARNAIRRIRLSFYIQRMVDWQEEPQREEEPELRAS